MNPIIFLTRRLCRRSFLGIFAAGFLLASADAPAAIIHVYFIGGQSNADGRANGSGSNLPSNLQTQNDVPFYFANPGKPSNALTTLQTGTSESNGFGPELTFGRSMADFYQPKGEKVALLKYAAGGTNLFEQWKAGGTAGPAGDGPFYSSFQTTINAGMLALQNANPSATLLLSGMLWVQGEADIDRTTSGTQPPPVEKYRDNLTAFINDLRMTYSASLPFLFSRISSNQTVYSTTTDPDYQNYLTLRAQQNSVAMSVAGAYLIDTDPSGFSTATPQAGPGLHYDTAGERALGTAFAARAQQLVPEPGSLLLLLSSVFCFTGRLRRAGGRSSAQT